RVDEISNGLCVRTANKNRSLAIPTTLEGFDEVKATLSQWTPLQSMSTDATRRAVVKNWILIIAALLGVAVLFVATDWWVVIPVSIILVGYMTYSYMLLRRIEGVDPNYRRRIAFGTIFIFLIAILMILASLTPFLRPTAR